MSNQISPNRYDNNPKYSIGYNETDELRQRFACKKLGQGNPPIAGVGAMFDQLNGLTVPTTILGPTTTYQYSSLQSEQTKKWWRFAASGPTTDVYLESFELEITALVECTVNFSTGINFYNDTPGTTLYCSLSVRRTSGLLDYDKTMTNAATAIGAQAKPLACDVVVRVEAGATYKINIENNGPITYGNNNGQISYLRLTRLN